MDDDIRVFIANGQRTELIARHHLLITLNLHSHQLLKGLLLNLPTLGHDGLPQFLPNHRKVMLQPLHLLGIDRIQFHQFRLLLLRELLELPISRTGAALTQHRPVFVYDFVHHGGDDLVLVGGNGQRYDGLRL